MREIFVPLLDFRRMGEKIGLPLSANAKERQLVAVRTFFREIQDDPHKEPHRFDPLPAFRTTNTLQKLLRPNPRALHPNHSPTLPTPTPLLTHTHLTPP